MNKKQIAAFIIKKLARRPAAVPEAVAEELRFVQDELKAAGVSLTSLQDLRQDPALWRKAIPTLAHCLSQVREKRVKEDLIDLLSVRFAKDAAPALIKEFHACADPVLRWSVGSAIEFVASEAVAEDLITLASDMSLGTSRQMVVMALGKLTDKRAFQVAISALSDGDVVLHALRALERMKKTEAIPYVQALLSHPRAPVRRSAKRVLQRLAKVSAH